MSSVSGLMERARRVVLEALEPRQLMSTWYVSASAGDDDNAGSLQSPFGTIQKAATVARPGDTVLVRAGTYRETVTIDFSGTPQGWYALRGYPGERPVIAGSDGWELLHLKGASSRLPQSCQLSSRAVRRHRARRPAPVLW